MSYTVVVGLASLLIISSLVVVLIRSLQHTAIAYGVQSLILVGCFFALSQVTGSSELVTWSGTAFLTKVILVPAIVLFALKKMGNPKNTTKPLVNPVLAVILAVVELAVCYAVVFFSGMTVGILDDAAIPVLAISLAHFFIGLTCIASQRNIVKQIFGYCLMENGSHLTLALLASSAPALVEIGIATDAIFAVIIMAVLVCRIKKTTGSLNSDELMELKG